MSTYEHLDYPETDNDLMEAFLKGRTMQARKDAKVAERLLERQAIEVAEEALKWAEAAEAARLHIARMREQIKALIMHVENLETMAGKLLND